MFFFFLLFTFYVCSFFFLIASAFFFVSYTPSSFKFSYPWNACTPMARAWCLTWVASSRPQVSGLLLMHRQGKSPPLKPFRKPSRIEPSCPLSQLPILQAGHGPHGPRGTRIGIIGTHGQSSTASQMKRIASLGTLVTGAPRESVGTEGSTSMRICGAKQRIVFPGYGYASTPSFLIHPLFEEPSTQRSSITFDCPRGGIQPSQQL